MKKQIFIVLVLGAFIGQLVARGMFPAASAAPAHWRVMRSVHEATGHTYCHATAAYKFKREELALTFALTTMRTAQVMLSARRRKFNGPANIQLQFDGITYMTRGELLKSRHGIIGDIRGIPGIFKTLRNKKRVTIQLGSVNVGSLSLSGGKLAIRRLFECVNAPMKRRASEGSA